MNRLESWLMHVSTILLTATGLIYAWMRYLMKPADPFSVVNHPLEPHMLHIHIIAAPLLVLGFGLIFHSHILFKKVSGGQTARRSGLILIPTFSVMVLTGYLLQVITSDFRKALVVVHLVSGGLWALLYIGHQVSSFAQRRVRGNSNRFRVPVQLLLVGLLLCVASTSHSEPFERQVQSMGTTLRVVILEDDHATALRHSEELIRSIEAVDSWLSTWKDSSELSQVNRSPIGKPVRVSRDLILLLQKMEKFTAWTAGAFDASIGRLIDIWDVHGKFRVPSNNEISDARNHSGFHHVRFDLQNGTLTRLKGVRFDPGAFGKGEALDRAIRIAAIQKMPPVLIDFGGQIAVWGVPPSKRGWSSEISTPQDRRETIAHEVLLTNGSLSTSGYSERSAIVDGRMVQHILNPATGFPAETFGSVTVWNSSALIADVLSTALYVMGPEAGYEWAVKNHIAAAFLTGHKVMETPEFSKRFTQS